LRYFPQPPVTSSSTVSSSAPCSRTPSTHVLLSVWGPTVRQWFSPWQLWSSVIRNYGYFSSSIKAVDRALLD
jgi:hypothetical protein